MIAKRVGGIAELTRPFHGEPLEEILLRKKVRGKKLGPHMLGAFASRAIAHWKLIRHDEWRWSWATKCRRHRGGGDSRDGRRVKVTESMADRAAPAVDQPRLVRLGHWEGHLAAFWKMIREIRGVRQNSLSPRRLIKTAIYATVTAAISATLNLELAELCPILRHTRYDPTAPAIRARASSSLKPLV